ncbi:MAG: response regulator, partial [Lachnospiraceae bacterium]|nr:response regulator [Lachnospiraceae bacterium]
SHYIVDFDENNIPLVAHGMGIDLTEQKNAEISFENRINAILRIAPESVATIQINLTENMCNVVSSANSQFAAVSHSKTVDDLVTGIMALISDKVEKMHFANVISRSSLLSAFNQGTLQLKLDHHLLLKKNLDEWVCTTAELLRNPVTSDVEAVIHINNIHRIKIFDSLINGTVQREFDYIALVYVKTDSYILIDKFNNDISEETPSFSEHFRQKLSAQIQNPGELEDVLKQIELTNLIEKINRHGEYTLQYNTCDIPEKNKHYVMRFSFLNSRRDIITISCRDSTRLYNEDQEQKRQISEALEAAESANRAKSDFLSLVSHDIRTPLNGIMGMTQLAYNESNPEKVKSYLKKAEMSSGFLLGLINDLLDMAKIESGKVEFNSEVYKFDEFHEYLNSVILPLCERKKISFNIHHDLNVSNIVVDKLRLNQIIFNLLSNACKYTNENGNVDLYTVTEKITDSTCIVTFTIKDNGIGMSEEFQNHLYETFSQENRVATTFNEGTGLGLAITHNLIELLGGDISVESRINEGTTFTVKLPCSYVNDEEIASNSPADEIVEKNSNGLKNNYSGRVFLLCEDNIINQEIASEIIINLGAKVEVADDGLMGVDMFKNSPEGYYSAIVMDIRMPNMDGLAASREIRKLDRTDAATVPIIAMTANAMSEDKMECIEAGMNAYIPKPINVNEFYKLLDEIVTLD